MYIYNYIHMCEKEIYKGFLNALISVVYGGVYIPLLFA